MNNLSRSSRLPQFEHRSGHLNGINLHYVETVEVGPPMILLHGIGMDWRVWQALSRRLTPFFHLHILDMRGHGASDKPDHGYTLAHYAADVEDFIEQRGLAGVVLLGSSLGGTVAAAVEAPQDVVAYRVLVDPPLTGGPVRDADMFRTILRLKHRGIDELANYLAASNPKAGRFYLRTMAEMWGEAADGVIADMLAEPDTYFALDSALRLNESPTLIVQADPEMGGVLSDQWARQALALLPRGSLLQFPGAGHAVHAYVPEEFTRAVLSFVGVRDTDAAPPAVASPGGGT